MQTADAAVQGLDVYVVGGAVRDALLGLPPGDRDWVVVGSTPEEMVRRRFTPVGGDFPVFLHPATKEEYALARTERKTGRGYQGFTFYTGPEVRLEDDLQRRDLTINAIAQRADGSLIDPLHGQRDIRERILRHVGDAFLEDPVRILRLARFAARFGDFSVAGETMALCRRMVQNGEVDALVPERVWKEISRALMAGAPSRALEVLTQCGALARILPGLHAGQEILSALDRAAHQGWNLPQRYAALCLRTEQRAELSARLRVPAVCADYARLLPDVLQAAPACDRPERQLALLERCDALRKPERLLELIAAASLFEALSVDAWRCRTEAVRSVDAGAIARAEQGDAARIKPALQAARLEKLKACGG